MIHKHVLMVTKNFVLPLILKVGVFQPLSAAQVVLSYEAEASTVVGSPFGLEIPRLTKVTGTLVYETSGVVDQNASPERGHYQLGGGGGFTAAFESAGGNSHLLTGSAGPWLEVENISVGGDSTIDTFRFWDGDDSDSKGGLMSFDGVVDGDYFLIFAMTDSSGEAFPGDALPDPFPMTGVKGPIGYPFPHTFVIGDGSGLNGTGRMLLQLTKLSAEVPEVDGPAILASGIADDVFVIEFESEEGREYAIEFSSDLETWQTIASGVPGEGGMTSFEDSGVRDRLGEMPGAAYYRVRID
jgi:hypothetical protein